jgi:Arm domain-containing DNA-binding protein
MAKIKITKRTVEALKITSNDYIAFDTDLPGFGVRVMPSGKRFFLVQYRRHGRTCRVMIGQFGIVTAELARREATIKLGSVRGADGDPAALRDAGRQSTTMKELGECFLTQYVPVRCKPSTQAEYRRSVELFLDPFFAKQRVRSVTTADVAELHGSLSHIGLLVGEGLDPSSSLRRARVPTLRSYSGGKPWSISATRTKAPSIVLPETRF